MMYDRSITVVHLRSSHLTHFRSAAYLSQLRPQIGQVGFQIAFVLEGCAQFRLAPQVQGLQVFIPLLSLEQICIFLLQAA